MKKFFLLLITAAAGSLASAQSPTAPALGFNVFLEKDARVVTNETEGPFACGRDLTLAGSYNVSTNYTGSYMVGLNKITLVVGGKVNYQSGSGLQVNSNGYVKIGDSTGSCAWYKDLLGILSPMRITPGVNYNATTRINLQASSLLLGVSALLNPVFHSNLINFSSAFDKMRTSALSMAACVDNAVITNANGGVISHVGLPSQIKITLNAGVNILNIKGSDLNNVQSCTYNNQPSATRILIVNVDAAGSFDWNVWNQAGIGFTNCPYILYNFYNCTNLNIKGSASIEGTVFAPYADIIKTVNQGNIEGQIIGQSYHHGGGENHYAPFIPNILGCIANTIASFSVNELIQCNNANTFRFTNLGTGTGPLSCLWDFGDGTTSTVLNPVKSFTAPGTYTVKLRINALGGIDSIVKTVTVLAAPAGGCIVDRAVQELTGNSFAFTTTASLLNNSFQWIFGDGTTSLLPNPVKTYVSTGPYHVLQVTTNINGCRDTIRLVITVASDSVGSGNGGGLESESLGDLVSKRDFGRIKNSIDTRINYSNLPLFAATPATTVLGKKGGLISLNEMIPAVLQQGDQLRVSTPADLVQITKALEAVSVDYTRNSQAKAVVLGIKTKDKPYSHTKYICDRLRGAKLISVNNVTIRGYEFVRFVMMQDDGTVEFGTSFVAGYKQNRNSYSLQTNWLLSEYKGDDTLYTFQVWATQPEYTDKLVGDIMDKLTGAMQVEQLNSVVIPKLYVTKGYRDNENLVLYINNKGAAVKGKLVMEQQLHEDGEYTELQKEFDIASGENMVYKIRVNDGYEYDANLYINDSVLADKIYMADGNWSLDYDKTATAIKEFKTSNDPSRTYNTNEYSVYRNVKLKASSNDYLILFKGINQGNMSTDLSAYESVRFKAKGKGSVQVTLSRDSIIQWQSQYKASIQLAENETEFNIPFSEFKSYNLSSPFRPVDVRMISFTFAAQSSTPESFEIEVGEIAFMKAVSGVSESAKENAQVGVFPNPNNGLFQLSFTSKQAETVQVTVSDVLGKEIYSETMPVVSGENAVQLRVPENKGLIFVSVKGQSIHATTRVLIAR